MPDIRIVQRRWRDIQEGDIIMDHSWRQPRWVTIGHIEHNDGGHSEVWFGGWRPGVDRADQERPLFVPPINLVDVQVEDN